MVQRKVACHFTVQKENSGRETQNVTFREQDPTYVISTITSIELVERGQNSQINELVIPITVRAKHLK